MRAGGRLPPAGAFAVAIGRGLCYDGQNSLGGSEYGPVQPQGAQGASEPSRLSFFQKHGAKFPHPALGPRQTAEASGAAPGVGVLEIGPGIGPLTAQLAQLGERVVSVELDRRLLPILAETLADYDNVEIVPGTL